MRVNIEPSIMYFGAPVVVISTLNEDGTTNIAPISSVWWLGWSCMIGLDATSKTTKNLKRDRRCVLNLVSGENASQVNNLALLTGSVEVPLHKKSLGYRYSNSKFKDSGFTPMSSLSYDTEGPDKVTECPIQLDAQVQKMLDFAENDDRMAVPAYAIEAKIINVNVDSSILVDGSKNKIDPNKWNPLIMNFRKFYSLSHELHKSRLAKKPEEFYAPWKKRGFIGALTNRLLKYSNRKHRV